MTDVSPLVERIARALHDHEYAARIRLDEHFHRPPSQETADSHWRCLPEGVRKLWRAQAEAVVDALNLETSVDATITTQDGTRIRTEYIVDGGWTELETQND